MKLKARAGIIFNNCEKSYDGIYCGHIQVVLCIYKSEDYTINITKLDRAYHYSASIYINIICLREDSPCLEKGLFRG